MNALTLEKKFDTGISKYSGAIILLAYNYDLDNPIVADTELQLKEELGILINAKRAIPSLDLSSTDIPE